MNEGRSLLFSARVMGHPRQTTVPAVSHPAGPPAGLTSQCAIGGQFGSLPGKNIILGSTGRWAPESARYLAGEPAVEIAFDNLAPLDHIVVQHPGPMLDQSFQSHASFRPLIRKFAQTLGVALRLTSDGISESGSKQGSIYNETVFTCVSCGHPACCRRNEFSQPGPNAEPASESGTFSLR